MRKTIVLSVAVLLSLASSVPLALAQGTYTQIDVPGAVNTYVYGINTGGDVVGFYYDSDNTSHGFVLSGGIYTIIDYPGALSSAATAINDLGQIVGIYFDGTIVPGFIYDAQTQRFANLVFPGSVGVFPSGINNSETIVGVISFTQSGKPPNVGFELQSGIYRKVPPQNFAYSYVTGISNAGVAVGGGSKGGSYPINFLFAGDQFQRLRINANFAFPTAINAVGTIVGSSAPRDGGQVGFLYDGKFMRLVFPGSIQTFAQGINDAGVVVGYFTDSSNVYHGFLWTPPAGAARK